MKLYKYSTQSLQYEKYDFKFYTYLLLILILGSIFVGSIIFTIFNHNYHEAQKLHKVEELKVIVLKEYNKFTTDNFIEFLHQLNIKFPYIVYAQAMLESTNFTSKIFYENHNLFGMKVAKTRQTTNLGEQYQHATYATWKDCVIDYALYQARYLSQITTEEQYLQYLSQSYAEDNSYVNKLQHLIETHQLKQLFKN